MALLPPQLDPLPAGATAVTPVGRPRWLPPLLPVFRTPEPLRISVLGANAPAWAWRLRSSLAALFASAGGRAGLQVLEWHDGFAIGAPGFDLVPALPHAFVLAAEFDPASVSAASRLILSLERERCFLVVQGDELGLDRATGLDPHRVIHFPIRGRAELAALARGAPPGLSGGAFGRACFGLARAIVVGYTQLER